MLNLNLMHINDDYNTSSDYPESQHDHHQSIRAENTYQLNSHSESDEDEHGENAYRPSFEIDHSLDDLSLDHDTFLQTLQRERITDKVKTVHHNMYEFKNTSQRFLTVDRNKVERTLIQTQSAEEVVSFTNITSYSIKFRFNQCSFQIHTEKSLSYVQAKQLQIVLEPFQEVSITFLIKPLSEDFGDVIETVVITAQFIEREECISPIQVNFNIHYVIPHLKAKFQGKLEYVSLAKNKISVVRLKANKIGEYSLELGLNEGCPKMNVSVQTRGKMTSFTSSLTLNGESLSSVKLRRKSYNNHDDKEKYLLLLRSQDTKMCFMIGVQFLS